MTVVRPAPRRGWRVAATAVLAAAVLAPVASAASPAPAARGLVDPGLPTSGSAPVRVVVQAAVDATRAVADRAVALGATVTHDLPIVHGFSATLPADRVAELSATPGVIAVTADRAVTFSAVSYDDAGVATSYPKSSQATAAWAQGNLGQGVGVAVIDTGVSPMADFAGRLVHGPDLSGDNSVVDRFGHGTVMAGVIGGDGAMSQGRTGGAYVGIAPKATIIGVKVAGANGATDVSTMLQAMHWVSAYKDQLNIRVLNISWGLRSTQDPLLDPLDYAVERLWQQGIVVVAAAGNSGPSNATITKPGDDPLAITVGAFDDKGTTATADDTVPDWASKGPTAQGRVKPDLVAPGRTLVSVRSFGSTIEQANPSALISPAYIRGSGTSQAAAATSGLAALLLSARPWLTPDQVKNVLTSTALPMAGQLPTSVGAGRVRLAAALTAAAGPAHTQVPVATGLGSLEASRGDAHVTAPCGTVLTDIVGDGDYLCRAWDPVAWTGNAWTGNAWTGNAWTGNAWTGNAWTGNAWTDAVWTGNAWTGGSWSGNAWTGGDFTGNAWTGNAWTGNAWTGNAWTGNAWTGNAWTGNAWTGNAWTGNAWTGNAWTSTTDDTDHAQSPIYLTAFWGLRPPWWLSLPGEISDPSPVVTCVATLGKTCPL